MLGGKNIQKDDELNAIISNSIKKRTENGMPLSIAIRHLNECVSNPDDFYFELKHSSFNPSRYEFFLWCQERFEDDAFKKNIIERYQFDSNIQEKELNEIQGRLNEMKVSGLIKENILSKSNGYWILYEEFFTPNGFKNLKEFMKSAERKGFLEKEPLTKYLSQYIPDNKVIILETLIERYSENDYVSFMHIFGHVIEILLSENHRKYASTKIGNKQTIGDYILKSKFYKTDEKEFLLFLLSKERGFGLRNKYVHFRAEELEYSKEICWLIIYSLIWLTKERSEKHVERFDTLPPGVISIIHYVNE